MRTRDEVLREFGLALLAPSDEEKKMADRIRELEAASGEPVAWAELRANVQRIIVRTALNRMAMRASKADELYAIATEEVLALLPHPPASAGVPVVTEAIRKALDDIEAADTDMREGREAHALGCLHSARMFLTAALTAASEGENDG